MSSAVIRCDDPFAGHLKEDRRLKRSLVGLVAGHFTEDEYAFYLEHQREVRRRLTALLTQRVLDQLDVLPLNGE